MPIQHYLEIHRGGFFNSYNPNVLGVFIAFDAHDATNHFGPQEFSCAQISLMSFLAFWSARQDCCLFTGHS
ncbi:hypothetical protein SAMN04489859_10544 [Paracoccus alcaliphilus]|uniref:Uncharacterized protein n=1 Tax=Paracoccus alcaliphilus TaxID=34002 RepID=A0A1H8N8B8_9RHOB|nr:hypothetical protein SAMN04489859_10544 [Paracoccus alcaliphilus]